MLTRDKNRSTETKDNANIKAAQSFLVYRIHHPFELRDRTLANVGVNNDRNGGDN